MRMLRCFALLLLVAMIPACGSKTNPGSTAAAGDKIKVAFITNNPYTFWKYAEAGCRAAEKEFNEKGIPVEVTVRMPKPEGGAAEQRRIIKDLQVQGIQAFAVSPNNGKGQTPYFKSLNKEVPLVLVDNDIDESDPANFEARRFYIGTNNVAAGESAGELLMKTAPEGGKFVIFVGRLDAQNAVERRKGVVIKLAGGEEKCKPQLADMEAGKESVPFGKFVLLRTKTDGGLSTQCQTQVEDTLTTEKDLKAMVGLWEYNPPAMYRAARKAGKLGEIKMVGFDENPTTLKAIEDDHMIGTIVQQPYQFGKKAVEVMVAIVRKDQEALKKLNADEHQRAYVPHRTIMKADVPGYRQELKDLLGEK